MFLWVRRLVILNKHDFYVQTIQIIKAKLFRKKKSLKACITFITPQPQPSAIGNIWMLTFGHSTQHPAGDLAKIGCKATARKSCHQTNPTNTAICHNPPISHVPENCHTKYDTGKFVTSKGLFSASSKFCTTKMLS